MGKHLAHLHRAKYYAKRVWQLKKRIKLLLLTLFLLYLAVLSQIYATWWVYPHTKLGNIDISGKSIRDVDRLIDEFSVLPYRVRVRDREYTYVYAKLGVILENDRIKQTIFERNRAPFPLNAIALVQSFFTQVRITPPLTFTQEFNEYIQQTVFEFSDMPDEIYFDDQQKSLVYVENEERYRIDENYFMDLLAQRLGDNTAPLYPKLVRIENEKAKLVADTSDRMKNVFLAPLTVLVDAGGTSQAFILSEKDLLDITDIQLSDDQTSVTVAVKEEAFTSIVNEKVKKLKLIIRGNVVTPKVVDDLQSLLTSRFDGHTVDALTISIDTGPNTTGSITDKYIEVDISQQKMYLFKNGKLHKTFRVSTGLDYPTPTGEFTILNKTGLGYSNIYKVWLPYWMGFKYSEELKAYFGIHELPYTLVDGKQIKRPRDFIGQPNTGGCVALDVGAAKEVYQFADIGTRVVIYN